MATDITRRKNKTYKKHTGIMICPSTLARHLRGKWQKLLDIAVDAIAPLLPLQRKVVFDNFGGRGMGDDPKYIALYLKKHYPKARLIWLAANPQEDFPEGIEPVRIYSRKARYHLYTAKVWVDNFKSLPKPEKRTGQFYIQTWHGGILGLKQAEAQVEEQLAPAYVAAAKRDAQMTDLMYSDNDFVRNIFQTSFWYNGPVLKKNLPRLAPILHPAEGLRAEIQKKLHIPPEKKMLLYAPTFRKNNEASLYFWNYEKVLEAMARRFGQSYVLLLRLHPNVAKLAEGFRYSDHVIPASGYPDMQELITAADALITDYSSTAFDCAITRKPVFLYGPDLTDYLARERSLAVDLKELPFKINATIEELCADIANFSPMAYNRNVDAFFNKIGLEENGEGDRQIAEIIAKQLDL